MTGDKTLEGILREYKFLGRNKNAFRKQAIEVDGLLEFCTKDGARAYSNLVSLLYDISKLTNTNREINAVVDALDYLVSSGGEY